MPRLSGSALRKQCAARAPPNPTGHRLLPPHCYNPKGDECSWYRECLEARYPCEGTGAGYAIEYAERFCNLYSANYHDFTADGRKWMDGVRKCLQHALAPSLHPYVAPATTCSDLRRQAIDSHPTCYIRPTASSKSGVPGISFCELPCSDLWRAFWLVSFEGGALFTEPYETLQQTWPVLVDCFEKDPYSGCLPAIETGFLVIFPLVPPHLRYAAFIKLWNHV